MNIHGDNQARFLEECLVKSMNVEESEASKAIINTLVIQPHPDLVKLSELWVSNYYEEYGCYPLIQIIKLINNDLVAARKMMINIMVECAITDYHDKLLSDLDTQFPALRYLVTGQELDHSTLVEIDYKKYAASLWGYFDVITWQDLNLATHKEYVESSLREIDLTSEFFLSDFQAGEITTISDVCSSLFGSVTRKAVVEFYNEAKNRLRHYDKESHLMMFDTITI